MDDSSALPQIQLQDWGLIGFEPAWQRQREIQQRLIGGADDDVVVMCEHPPTVTAGSSTKDESFLKSPEELAKQGVAYFKIERGGDLTFHGPGQLVCYPLLNLNRFKRDVHWYMRALERAIIATCAEYGVICEQIPGRTGVWIAQDALKTAKNEESCDVWIANPESVKTQGRHIAAASAEKRRKIASIGVRLSRWCSMHGLALNVEPQADFEKLIVPCGLSDISVTSLSEERARNSKGKALKVAEVSQVLARALATEIGFKYISS